MKKHLLLAEFARQPWAMDQTHLATFAAVLRRWSAGQSATPEVMADVHAAQAARATRAKTTPSIGGGIAVLPLYGVMSQRASMVDDISGAGGTSTQVFTQSLRAALSDDTIGGIIIDIDSPGGSVFGTGELATEILNARGTKPVYGFVNSLCASAAYWVGSQCAQLFITRGGQAGSIGVYMQHVDESAALEAEGYKIDFISAGKFKTEGNSLGPLPDEARAFLQSRVDAYYVSFTSGIAKGRGAPIGTVRDGMGQGRCLLASDALAAGMVDGICTFDDVVAKMTKAIKSGNTGARATVESIDVVAELEQRPVAHVIAAPVAQEPAPVVTSNRTAKNAARRREVELAGM